MSTSTQAPNMAHERIAPAALIDVLRCLVIFGNPRQVGWLLSHPLAAMRHNRESDTWMDAFFSEKHSSVSWNF